MLSPTPWKEWTICHKDTCYFRFDFNSMFNKIIHQKPTLVWHLQHHHTDHQHIPGLCTQTFAVQRQVTAGHRLNCIFNITDDATVVWFFSHKNKPAYKAEQDQLVTILTIVIIPKQLHTDEIMEVGSMSLVKMQRRQRRNLHSKWVYSTPSPEWKNSSINKER